MKLFAPASFAQSRKAISCIPVMRIMRREGKVAFRRSQICMPLVRPSIQMSMRTRSGRSRRHASSASSESVQVPMTSMSGRGARIFASPSRSIF